MIELNWVAILLIWFGVFVAHTGGHLAHKHWAWDWGLYLLGGYIVLLTLAGAGVR